jgi:hypothetical protein
MRNKGYKQFIIEFFMNAPQGVPLYTQEIAFAVSERFDISIEIGRASCRERV